MRRWKRPTVSWSSVSGYSRESVSRLTASALVVLSGRMRAAVSDADAHGDPVVSLVRQFWRFPPDFLRTNIESIWLIYGCEPVLHPNGGDMPLTGLDVDFIPRCGPTHCV